MKFSGPVLAGFLLAAAALAPPAAAQGPEAAVSMKIEGYALGRPDAPLTMVEFSDYQCSFCGQFQQIAFAHIKRNYIDTGKLRYVVRDFPLPTHRHAIGAARAARCAGDQGKFWEMRATLFENQAMLNPESLLEHGERAGVDTKRLGECIASGRFDADLRKDFIDARAIGVHSTPTFVIGRSRGDMVDGRMFEGSQPFDAFDARLKALLTEQL